MSSKEQEASPAYLWYPKDVLSSGRVESLTAEEECWYRRALDRSWMDEGIPSDPATCARYIGKGCTPEGATTILDIFFEPKKKDATKMVNARQEKERKAYRDKRKITSQERRKAANIRWEKERAKGDANTMQKSTGNFDKNIANPVSDENKGTLPYASAMQNDAISSSISISIKEETYIKGDAATEGDWGYPMQPLIDAFPNVSFTPAAIGFIEARVKPGDEEAWAKTIEIYQMNYDPMLKRYLPDKPANLLGVFDKQKADIERQKNGSTKTNNFGHKRTDQDVFAESADFYANYDEQLVS
jgi:uncharacterized protein YdaU (DUF1376 family)